MSAISSLSSFSFRPQGAMFSSAQQAQRGGTTYGTNSAARGGNAASSSSAYCPTCGIGGGSGGARSSTGASSSYCPTCNTAGGRQSGATSFNSNPAAQRSSSPQAGAANRGGSASHAHQGGQICVACAYQGR